jgi:hypothetical protein
MQTHLQPLIGLLEEKIGTYFVYKKRKSTAFSPVKKQTELKAQSMNSATQPIQQWCQTIQYMHVSLNDKHRIKLGYKL